MVPILVAIAVVIIIVHCAGDHISYIVVKWGLVGHLGKASGKHTTQDANRNINSGNFIFKQVSQQSFEDRGHLTLNMYDPINS